MSKKKIPDYTLVDSFETNNNRAKAMFSPKVDTDAYLNVVHNPPYEGAPNNFNWFSNAFYDWNLTRNQTNKDTALGEYVYLQEDYETLEGAKQYLQAINDILNLQEDNNTDEQKEQHINQLNGIIEQTKPSYDKLLNKEFNNNSIKAFILPERLTTLGPQQQIDIIDKLLTGTLQEGGVIARRNEALEQAKKYQRFAEYWESKMNSDYYNKKKSSPGMDLTDIDTYLYKMPGLLGSSASSLGSQLTGTIGALFSTKGGLNTVAGLSAVLLGNISARDQESKAEVYSNYKQSLINAANKENISKSVLQEAKQNMIESGQYTPEQIQDDDYVYDQVIADRVKVSNVKFNKLRISNLKGLKSLYMDNMALSGSDIIQTFLEVTPLHSMFRSVRGLKFVSKLVDTKAGKTVETIANKYGTVKEQLADRIDDIVSFGIDNVNKLPRLTRRKQVLDIGGRVVISSALEGAEEGTQYIKGQRYINRDFDSDPNLLKSWAKNIGTGARSIFAAITPWDPVYSDDEEFLENFKGGALLGGIMTGAIGTATSIQPVNRQISGQRFLAGLYADGIASKDQVRKNIQYSKSIREGRWATVYQAFDDLEQANIDGIDSSVIQEEKKRANQFYNTFTSRQTLQQAIRIGIDPRTEDYDIFVSLKQHHDEQYNDARGLYSDYVSQVDNILYSPEVQEHILNINKDLSIDQQANIRALIKIQAELEASKKLVNDVFNSSDKLDEIQKYTGIKVNKSDVNYFSRMLSQHIKDLEEQYNDLKKYLPDTNIKDEQLEVPKAHQDLNDAYEKTILAKLDLDRAQNEYSIMNSTDEKLIKSRIDRWKGVENRDEEFVQRLNDSYSGKQEEKVIEESEDIKPELVDNTTAPVEVEPIKPEQQKETEPQYITDTRNAAEWIQRKYFKQERDERGNNKQVLNADNIYGQAYNEATEALREAYHKINPNAKKFNTFSASIILQDPKFSKDERADLWEDLINTRNQLEEEVYSNGNSSRAKELVNLVKEKIEALQLEEDIITSYNEFVSSSEQYIHEKMLQIKDKEHKITEQQDALTPVNVPESPKAEPTQKSQEEEPAKMEDLPSLGSLLGGLIGQDAAQALDTAYSEPQTPEDTSASISEPEPKTNNGIAKDLTYDQQLDPYSHELNYRLSNTTQDANGKWTVVTYKKFQGMEDYLNNEDFSKVSANDDFLKEVENSGVYFEVKPYTNPQGQVEDAIYAIFIYKGKKYIAAVRTSKGLYANRSGRFNKLPYNQQQYIVNNLNDLRNKITELYKQVQANPNLQVVPTQLRRTPGSIVNEKNSDNSPKNRPLTESKWLTIKDPYEITPENTEVGITTGPAGKGMIRLRNRVLSYNGRAMGKPAWIIKATNYDGTVYDKPVILNYKKFSDSPKVADLILDLVLSNQNQYTDANGVQTPINPKELLKFLVNFGTHTIVNPNSQIYSPEQIQQRLTKQFFEDENGNIVIGTTTYVVNDLLTDETIRNKAKQYIMDNFHYNIDEDGLNKNYLGGDLQSQDRDPHFEQLYSYFKNSDVEKITIIPGELEFTRKDFGLEGNPKGISVLGWYIKQGILLTDIADQLQDANIYVDDVRLVDKTVKQVQQEANQKLQESVKDDLREKTIEYTDISGNKASMNLADIYAILDGKKRRGPNMTVDADINWNIEYNQEDKMDAQQAKEWIQKTLGITPDIIDNVIDVTESGMNVVGRVTEDSILLYNEAPKGTEYHEAWHRVSQLLISEKSRRKIYDRYNRKNKSALKDSQLDEIFAEQFREFMLNESGKYDFDTKNWFRRILDFIKLWARTGQYAIAKIYSNINRGKYAGITPNQSNIDRFRSIYGGEGPNFEISGYEFKTITKYKQFDDIVKSLTYAFFNVAFAEGKYINYSDLNESKPTFERLKLIVQAQANKFPSPTMTEVVDTFDTVFAPVISTRLKQLGIRTIDRNSEDLSVIEEVQEGIDVAQHTVEGMNISIKDNAPAEVKFFFQTIPMMERGKDGNYQTKIDDVTHFASFVDSNQAWNNVLKDLSGCRTITNIFDKVNILSQNDSFYMSLLLKLGNEIQKSNSDDIRIATDAEALLTKLETVITSDINNFITAKISKDKDTGFTKASLVDNTVDIKAIKYPKVWSQALFTNSGLFKYDKDGKIVADPDAKKYLKLVIDNLTTIRTAFMNRKGILKVGDRDVDLHIPMNQEWLKDRIVSYLQAVGIGIDKPTINRMLLSGDYGNPRADSYTLLNSFVVNINNFGGLDRITEVLNTINNAIKFDNTLSDIIISGKTVSPKSIWSNVGYVKTLANYYAYVHSTDKGLSSYGPDGNTYYMVSQNNFVKDRVQEMITDPQVLQDLRSVNYNQHSIVLNAISQGNKNIQVETLINFKDETSYDAGRDYFGITDREDYIAKMTAVLNDRIIFPTVADKKTYHFLRGIKLPHERINFTVTSQGTYAQYGEQSLDILIGYCQDELSQIELCLRQIDDDPAHYDKENNIHYNEDGTINNDWLEPNRRIKNFHTPNTYKYTDKEGKKHTVKLEGNGARFLFLTDVYANGKFINFNDPKKSAKECLQLAKDYFFNAPKDAQKMFLSDLINRRVKEEIETAKNLGLITGNDNNSIWSLRNSLLDDNELIERTKAYTNIDPDNAEGYAIFDMIADYTINSIISITEIEKLFSGSPAYYKVKYDENGIIDLSVDKIKRLGALTSTGLNNRLDFNNDPIRQEYVVAELKDHEIQDKQYYEFERLFTRGNIKETIQELEGEEAWNEVKHLSIQEIEKIYPDAVKVAKQAAKVEVAGYKEGINVADAAVYISPTMTRDLLRMRGEWSTEVKEAFDVLTNDNTADTWESDPELYAKANKVILNAMKYMAFGTRFNEIDGLGIPYFNKMALFPLFKSIATGDTKAMYDRMMDPENPIDMIMFDSAVKAGSRSPMKAYREAKDSEIELKDGQTVLSASVTDQLISGEGNTLNDFNNLVTYKQKFKYLRQQLATNPHTHEEQMAGTQFMKVNLSNIRMNDMYGKEGNQVTGRDIKNTVMESLNKLSDMGKQQLASELFTKDGKVNITKLGTMLYQDAKESDANDNVLTGLRTKDDAFVIPLSALSDNKWIESRFIAMINKIIIDVMMPGGAFIQRSAFGIEATSTKVITTNMINDGRALKMNNEEGSMDSVVSINLFKHIIPNYEKMTFRQARRWLIDKKIIGPESTANAIGYRIPTQSIASISALRFVDVFPEIMGDTIMLPEGFTKLTGSDFDIDKLYVARFAYNKLGGKITKGTALKVDEVIDSYKNEILDAYMKVLLTQDNFNSLKLSIDNATENTKEVLKDIESNREVHYVQPFEVYTPTYQEARKAEYTGGKAGIGPFALNNAHHILTQLTGLKMVDNEFTRTLDLIDLGRIYDYPTAGTPKGRRILDWLSAMINGFVDIAKDPYIVRLNVNSWTYNMVNFLLRTGKGKWTFYFVGQPIFKEIAEEVAKTKGKYGVDRTKTPSQLEKEAIKKVLDKYDPTGGHRSRYQYINTKTNLMAEEYKDLFKTEIVDGKETSYTRELLLHPNDFEFNREQIRMYYAWLALKPYADGLADLVKYSKVDTKKTGKSFAEQQIYYNGMKDLTNSMVFEEGEIQRFYDETFIGRKTENSIPFGASIFSNLLFRSTNTFIKQYNAVLSLLGRKNNANAKLLNPIISGMESQIKTEFFNQFVKDNGIDVEGMFKGNNTIAKRLNKFNTMILKGDERYKYLLNSNGSINNDFLEYLIPNIDNEGIDFIDTSELLSADQAQGNNLINYWRELLDDPLPEVKRLARDLAVYAFYTSGDNFTMNSFFQYLPNSYRQEIGYTDFVQNKLEQLINESQLAYKDKADLFLNNWTNDLLVKPVEMEGGKNRMPFIQAKLNEQATPNIIVGKRVGSEYSDIKPINWVKVSVVDALGNPVVRSYPMFPPYIKMRDGKGFDTKNWHVYTLIGFTDQAEVDKSTGKFTGKMQYTPIYGLVSKKGYKHRGHTIVEYGRETQFDFNKENEWDYREALNNPLALADMASEFDKTEWNKISNSIHLITSLPSYSDMNYAIAEQDRVYMDDSSTLEEDEVTGEVLEEKEEPNGIEQNGGRFSDVVTTVRDTLKDETFNNTESTNNDPINFASKEESINTIQSNKTILSNKELIKLRPYAGNSPRIAVASEHTDPVFFSKKIIEILDGKQSVQDKFRNTSYTGNDFAALYLITKHDGLPLKNLLEYKIPKLIHFSITGLGGTKWEPGVMHYNDLLDRIQEFIKQGLDPEMVTVRIDPIIPGVTLTSDVENIVRRASEMGIKNIRFSVMDQYSTTKKFMEELGYDYSKYYDGKSLHARPEILQSIENKMLELKNKYKVNISTCAEPFNIEGISKEACLSVAAINNMLGTNIPETSTGKQRALCSCYGGKTDLLRYDNKCASSCIYCYAHHNNNKNLNYYNEDGTLKDNPFTRTTAQTSVNENKTQYINHSYEKVLTKENTKKLNFDEVASKVFDLVNRLGIQTVLVDPSQLVQRTTAAQYDSDNNRILLRNDYKSYLDKTGTTLNRLLLHEYIHVITSYAIDNADEMPADVQTAVKTIEAAYKTLLEKEKGNYIEFMGSLISNSDDYYGLTSKYEMIAELANPNFRKILNKHNLLDGLISNIKDLIFKLFDKFGISHNSTLEDSLIASLNTLVDNFDSTVYNNWNKTRTAQRWFRDNIQRVSLNKFIGNKVMDQVNKQLENKPYEEVAEITINIPISIAENIYNQLGGQNAKNKPFVLSFDGGSVVFARLTGLKPSDKKMQGKYSELDTYDMTIETHPEIIPIEEYEKAGNQYRPLADVGSTQALTGIDLVSLYDQGNRRVSEVLDQLSDLTQEERQTYLNEFAQYMRDNNVNTQDKLEEALRKFICNL